MKYAVFLINECSKFRVPYIFMRNKLTLEKLSHKILAALAQTKIISFERLACRVFQIHLEADFRHT
jgi:hypothetical protein